MLPYIDLTPCERSALCLAVLQPDAEGKDQIHVLGQAVPVITFRRDVTDQVRRQVLRAVRGATGQYLLRMDLPEARLGLDPRTGALALMGRRDEDVRRYQGVLRYLAAAMTEVLDRGGFPSGPDGEGEEPVPLPAGLRTWIKTMRLRIQRVLEIPQDELTRRIVGLMRGMHEVLWTVGCTGRIGPKDPALYPVALWATALAEELGAELPPLGDPVMEPV